MKAKTRTKCPEESEPPKNQQNTKKTKENMVKIKYVTAVPMESCTVEKSNRQKAKQISLKG
jgi:hypothetical protein